MFGFFTILIAGLITLFCYVFFTDEYTVEQEKECISRTKDNNCTLYDNTYFCKIENGETLRICKDAKECSDYCDKARGKK